MTRSVRSQQLFMISDFMVKKRSPGNVRRQICNVAPDAREISLSRIVDKAWRLFSRLQISHGFQQESANLNDIRIASAEILFCPIDDGTHAFCGAGVLV